MYFQGFDKHEQKLVCWPSLDAQDVKPDATTTVMKVITMSEVSAVMLTVSMVISIVTNRSRS